MEDVNTEKLLLAVEQAIINAHQENNLPVGYIEIYLITVLLSKIKAVDSSAPETFFRLFKDNKIQQSDDGKERDQFILKYAQDEQNYAMSQNKSAE